VFGHGKPMFGGAGATSNMYSMLPHKQNTVSPPRILLRAVYGVCNDGMSLAGEL
jgi:hypothetical protein